MVQFFERRAREAAGHCLLSLSQGPQGSPVKMVSTDTNPGVVQQHQEYTERDDVLQTLLQRSEEKKTGSASSKDASAGKLRWVSKWDFNFQKTEKLEPAPPKEEEEVVKSPVKKSRAKITSPTSQLSPRSNNAKSVRRSPRKRTDSEKQTPVKSCSRSKKRPSSERTSPKKSVAKAKHEPKPPPEKKAKGKGVVDLTFSDSDSG